MVRFPDRLRAVTEEAEHEPPIILTLRLREGDAVSGSVAGTPELEPIAFYGWVELMNAINRLRSRADS